MKKIAIVLIFLCFLSKAQLPGEIVGTTFAGSSEFKSLDLTTEISTALGTLGGKSSAQGSSTYDKINNIYFFKLGTVAIYKVDAKTGIPLDSINGMVSFSAIEYDEVCDCIYGIYYDNSTSQVSFSSIDFSSKVINQINPVTFGPNVFGESTYDQVNGRYFRAGQSTIEVIDTQGNLLDVLPKSHNLTSFEYDEINDRLVGIYFDASNDIIIASLDLTSQQLTEIDTIPFTSSILTGESAFDQINSRYFFHSADDLYVYDLQNLSLTMISDPSPGRITGLEYKAAPVVITTALENQSKDKQLRIYPNPATGKIFIEGLEVGSTIQLYNVLGAVVNRVTAQQKNIQIDLKDQVSGIYFYELMLENKKVTGKIIVN